MKERELRVWPDQVLRRVCEPVESFDAELRDLVEAMEEAMRVHHGLGLAAPQIGEARRVFVCQAEGRPLRLVNPVVQPVGQAIDEMDEGCLSLPGVSVTVARPSMVVVQARDPRGQAVSALLRGLDARVVLHETDHLDGRLIIDRQARGAEGEAQA